jgi:hypothetical protein
MRKESPLSFLSRTKPSSTPVDCPQADYNLRPQGPNLGQHGSCGLLDGLTLRVAHHVFSLSMVVHLSRRPQLTQLEGNVHVRCLAPKPSFTAMFACSAVCQLLLVNHLLGNSAHGKPLALIRWTAIHRCHGDTTDWLCIVVTMAIC